ncbi:MAG TPA: hypothetical protein VGB38_08930, partial [bacterium]
VVASDTPENLTRRLKGSESIRIDVAGPKADVESKIRQLKGVTKITSKESGRSNETSFTVEADLDTDIRRNLAACIVNAGWGLLEMRPIGMSLEEIFLHLTTKEEEVSGS